MEAETEERPHEAMAQNILNRVDKWGHFGCTPKNALDQRWASALGRYRMRAQTDHGDGVSEDQYQAGLDFLNLHRRWLSAKDIPRPGGRTKHATESMDEEEYVKWCNECQSAYFEAERAVNESHDGPLYLLAVRHVVIDDGMFHGIGQRQAIQQLRCGLNILENHFRR